MTEEKCACVCERDATHGLLCTEHGVRLADHYGAREGLGGPGRESHGLPWMWDHLQVAYPSLSGWSGGNPTRDGIEDAEAEKLSAVMVLRQEIHDHLVITARELADDLGRSGPDLATTARLRVQRSARWLLANIEPLRAAQGARATEPTLRAAALEAARQYYEEAGLGDVPAGAIIQGPIITEAIAAAHADAGAHRIRALLVEADDLAFRAHSLAPWRAVPTRIDWAPCRCGAVGTIHDFGDVRKCFRCTASFDEIHWAALTKAMAHRFSQEGQTA